MKNVIIYFKGTKDYNISASEPKKYGKRFAMIFKSLIKEE